MRRFFIVLILFLGTGFSASAQDSIFDSRSDMQNFIWEVMKNRQFDELVLRLGGRDEYTTEQLGGIQAQFSRIYPKPFTHAKQVEENVMENGFRREIVSFWVGVNYAWLYLFTHERDGKVVVMNFRLNSSPNPVFELM